MENYILTINTKDGKEQIHKFTDEKQAVKRLKNSYKYNLGKGEWLSNSSNFVCATPFWNILYADDSSACARIDVEIV